MTGASSGIGRSGRAVRRDDFDLVVTAEENEIVTAARELKRSGASVQAVQVDLSNAEGVEELYRRVSETRRPLEPGSADE